MDACVAIAPGDSFDIPQENGWLYVQERMEDLVSCSDSHGLVNDRSIVVEIRHPHVPSIDLVDLPGLAGSGEKKAVIDKILQQQLDYDARTGHHDMFLAVVPASGDVRPSTNMAVNFIQEKKLNDRTFGVFSKCDQTCDTEILKALVLNENTAQNETPEELGQVSLKSWVACMLGPPKQGWGHLEVHNFERLFKQTRNEMDFFGQGDNHMKALVEAKKAGIPCLVQSLEKGYSDYLHKSWKDKAMRKILRKLELKQSEFRDLGVVDLDAQRLAQEEVEKRLGAQNTQIGDLYKLFIDEHISPLCDNMQKELTDVTEGQYDVVQLKKSILQLEESLQRNCELTTNAVVGCFVGRLGEIVTADVQRRSRITGKRDPRALFTAFGEIMQNREFIQLKQYPDFTNAVIGKCRHLFEGSVQNVRNDLKTLISGLAAIDSPWLHPSFPQGGVKVAVDAEKFLDRVKAAFLRNLPSPDELKAAAKEVEIGVSSADSLEKARELKDELEKICRARDGLRSALFNEEELRQFKWD